MIANVEKPTLFIVDGSTDVTGALVSAARQSELLQDQLDTILVLSSFHRVPAERTEKFADLIALPFVSPRKKIVNIIFYLPALLLSSIQLKFELQRRGCSRLQINDFYLLHGAILRLLGFRGRITTFVRIDPTRYGVIGKIWLQAARWSSTEIASVSRFIQSLIEPSTPSRLIYGQVSLAKVTAAKPDLDQPLFLCVGNYIQGKGQEHAIQAFNNIAARYPRARLRFVGGDMGLEKNRLFRKALGDLANNGPAPDRIEFYGSTNDVSPHYAAAFAAINFSESESFSITCLDGSAAGLPVVATRCGGPEEIVQDGRTGFLVPVREISAMADRLGWLLDHPADAAAMGTAGRALVATQFSPERAKLTFNEILDLRSERAPPRPLA